MNMRALRHVRPDCFFAYAYGCKAVRVKFEKCERKTGRGATASDPLGQRLNTHQPIRGQKSNHERPYRTELPATNADSTVVTRDRTENMQHERPYGV